MMVTAQLVQASRQFYAGGVNEAALHQARRCGLMACSRMIVLPEYEEQMPVTIWVRLTDGSEAQTTMAHHRGMPQDPATEAELIDKFTMFSAGRYPSGYGRRVLDLLQRPRATARELLHSVT